MDVCRWAHLIGAGPAALDWTGSAWPAALIGLLILGGVALDARRRRRRERNDAPDAETRAQRAALRDQRAVQRDMEEALVQLEQLAGRVQAQFDERFVKLEQVLRDADERIARLERLVGRADGRPTLDVTLGDDADAPVEEAPRPAARHRTVYALADAGRSPLEIAQETGQTTGEIELILALRRRAS